MRNIKRNILRRKYGNKALGSMWRSLQLRRYGKYQLALMHKICNPSAAVINKGRLLSKLNKHRSENR